MLDLETLATDSNACIISIGAVEFDLEGVKREFYAAVDAREQDTKYGRTVSSDTVAWWSQQSEEARRVLNDPTAVDLSTALQYFSTWIGQPPDEMWGDGSDFDNVILGSAYEACHLPRPWSYSNNRCYRTLKNLGVPLQPGDGICRTVHHHALDDAKVQAHYAGQYLRYIKLGQDALKEKQ